MKLSCKEFPNTICLKLTRFYYDETEKEKNISNLIQGVVFIQAK